MTKQIAVVNFFSDSMQKDVDHREYHFFSLINDLEKGDIVAVRTRNGLRFASFNRYIATSNYANAFIITKVDEGAVKDLEEKEEKVKQIKQQLEERMQEVKRMEEYKTAANTDDTMKKLLAELEDLN